MEKKLGFYIASCRLELLGVHFELSEFAHKMKKKNR